MKLVIKKIKKHHLSIVMILLLLNSCGRIIQEDVLWQPDNLPVVFSVISPTQRIQVSLSRTFLKNNSTDTIRYDSAKVYVKSEHSNWIELTKPSQDVAMFWDALDEVKVLEGNTYSLRVELPDITLAAKTTVPHQKAEILEASFVLDKDVPEESDYFRGTLKAHLSIQPDTYCILLAMSDYLMNVRSTFLQQEYLSHQFSVPATALSFELKLIIFDPFLAKFWAAKQISSLQHFSEGDFSVLMGAYNGLLPDYSNIENGIGLFGSYLIIKDTVTVNEP